MISRADRSILANIVAADGASFVELAELAGLDPATAFRGADLRNVDFAGCDLAGFDFTDADLTGASFVGASTGGASFEAAITRNVTWDREKPRKPRRAEPPRLSEIQIAAIESMAAGLEERGRALALMPTGTGRSGVLEETIARVMPASGNRAALIVSSAAERDQTIDRLRERLAGVPILTVKQALTHGGRHGLIVHNTNPYDAGFSLLLKALANFGRVDALFATSVERLQQLLRAGAGMLDEALIAAVDTPLLDGDRPDRRRLLARVEHLFGDPAFLLDVRDTLRFGILAEARIVAPVAPHVLPQQQFFMSRRGPISGDELQGRMAAITGDLIEVIESIGIESVLVLCRDELQAQAVHALIEQRWRSGDALSRRAGSRWSANRIVRDLCERGGTLISTVTRQAIKAGREVDCVAVLAPLNMASAQDIALRSPPPIESLPPLVLDFANAFQGFPNREYGMEGLLGRPDVI